MERRRSRGLRLLALLPMLVALAAPGLSRATDPCDQLPQPARSFIPLRKCADVPVNTQVFVENGEFLPSSVTVSAGGSITFNNLEIVDHTIYVYSLAGCTPVSAKTPWCIRGLPATSYGPHVPGMAGLNGNHGAVIFSIDSHYPPGDYQYESTLPVGVDMTGSFTVV